MKVLHFKRKLETMNNRERLMAIMTEQDLDRLRLAELLKVKRAEVDNWLLSRESKNNKEIPDMAIELLEVKLDLKD